MALPDPSTFDGLALRSDDADYPDALVALVRALGPRCDAGYALLERPPPAVDDPGVLDPRATWRDVEAAFVPTWTGWRNEDAVRRWHRVALPDGVAAVGALADLTRTGAGQWFVRTLALAREGEWLLVAVPHSRLATLRDDDATRAAATEALASLRATVVDDGTVVSWSDGEREFRVERGYLRSDGGGNRRGWPLARVARVERVGRRGVRLEWRGREPGDVVQRVVGRLLPDPDPPRTLAFPDAATRERAADAIESFLDAYRPSP